MIEWEVDDGHLRVVDADNAEVTVEGRGLTVAGPGPAISRPVDETVEATASQLRFPHAIVYAFSLGHDEQYELDPSGDPLSLPSGEYIVDIDTEIKIYLRFSGRATISQADDYEHIELTFPERRRVILGFRSHHELPAGTITVPSTPDGIATAITHLTSGQKTSTADRTYPTLRGHPPLVRRGSEYDIPDRIESSTPDTGIELLVPATYESLFVTAPLAYYLQARVRTIERDTPTLRLPDVAREVSLSPMPTLERDVEQLLRKTFFLDCLARNAGPYRADLSELSMLDALELDAQSLYEATPQQRLATALDVPYGAIEHRLPEWHLTTYVDPTPSNAELLPFLLDRLSLLALPRTSELEGKELVERSLEDFYRGSTGRRTETGTGTGTGSGSGSESAFAPNSRAGASQVASVDIVKPDLKSGQAHGWLADGVPIDVFKSAPEAYYNRLNYLEDGGDTTSICIVLNDRDMDDEHTDVAEIYRQRSDDLAIDVTVEESLGTADLARVFETDHDFVHYIGHCETDGLRCSDGSLSISSLDRCNAQTFFLNACGSFYEGLALIEKGSVAGAVTFTKVLNDHAVKVGSTFAKLLIHGFSIERAMSLARRRIMMGKDYAVVGDGTHSLTQGEHRVPTTATVERLDDDRYLLSLECFSTQMTGLYYYPHVETNEHAYLCGTESSFTLDTAELVSFLKESETPVIYDGDVYWSQDLWSLLES